jgi:hypothetical protein
LIFEVVGGKREFNANNFFLASVAWESRATPRLSFLKKPIPEPG